MGKVIAKYWYNMNIQQILITVPTLTFCFIAQTGACREKSLFHNIFKGGVSTCKHPRLWVARRIPGTPGNWCHCIVFARVLLTAPMFNFNLTLRRGIFSKTVSSLLLSHVAGGTDCVSLVFPVVISFCAPSEELSDWLRAWTPGTVCYPIALHGAAKCSCGLCLLIWSLIQGGRRQVYLDRSTPFW